MTLLEVIAKTSANAKPPSDLSMYPFIINPDECYVNLKFESEDPDESSLVRRVTGWKFSETYSDLLEYTRKFYQKLNRNLKGTRKFNRREFTTLLTFFLENTGNKVGYALNIDGTDKNLTCALVEKLGFLMGRDVARLVTEACVVLEAWELLGCLIRNGLIQHSVCSSLIMKLVEKRRLDLLVECLKCFEDLPVGDVLYLLKYFLGVPQHESGGFSTVRKEWWSQGSLAIELVSNGGLANDELILAKDASILLMMAHDEFSDSELCLHYLLSSLKADEVVMGSAIGRLDGSEVMGLIRYLGKWLRKYERFPQACSLPVGPLRFLFCKWIPTLEDVVRCLGVVVDEHFSLLVLHPEFHAELIGMVGLVDSLGLEAKLCSSVANLGEDLRIA